PGADRSIPRAADDPAVRRINLERRNIRDFALLSLNDSERFRISACGAIEYEHRAAAVHNQAIVYRIGSHGGNSANLRVRPHKNAPGSNISVRIARKDQDAVFRNRCSIDPRYSGADRQQDFVVYRIDADFVVAAFRRSEYLRVRPLNDAY